MGLLNNHFKSANEKLSELKNTAKLKRDQLDKVHADLEAERLRKEIESLDSQTAEKRAQSKFERKFFMDQVNWELNDYPWEKCHDIDKILHMISTLESRLDKFQEIRSHYIGILGEEFETNGSDIEDEKLIASIREKLSGGKIWFDTKDRKELQLRQELENSRREKEMAEQERSQTAEMKEKIKIENLLSCAENLHYEIKTRYNILTAKCTIDVDKLSDYAILDFKKHKDCINSELRKLIDKASSFETFVLPCGDAAADMREVVKSLRNRSTIIIEKFLKKLAEIILDRDISEKKLKNSAGLNIKLSKFTGYNSESGIYTFCSEFQKLIEHNVQKCLWSDYIKNFLGGAAHNLVSKEESIEEIWMKLLKVYETLTFYFKIR